MNSLSIPKLTSKQESDICLSCGECCKRYWITVLPSEAKKLAKALKLSEKMFLEDNCILLVKFFPKSTPGLLTVPNAFISKNVFDALKKEFSFSSMPHGFFIVPQIVLKRQGKDCGLLLSNNKCKAYSFRPEPCKLFPFIAMEGLREQYPFCELFHVTTKDYSKQSRAYYKKVQAYFETVSKKGFFGTKNTWKYAPKKGLLFLKEKEIGKITLEEINEILRFASKKK